MDKTPGVDRSLYKVKVFNENGTQAATIKVIANTRRDAYWTAAEYLPKHRGWDADWQRFAEENEAPGVILTKNDFKRKK